MKFISAFFLFFVVLYAKCQTVQSHKKSTGKDSSIFSNTDSSRSLQSNNINKFFRDFNFDKEGDARYSELGDINRIMSGTLLTSEISNFLRLQRNNDSKPGGGDVLKFKQGIYRTNSSNTGFVIEKNNTKIEGEGIGTTTLHFESNQSDKEIAFRFRRPKTLSDRLLRGIGLRNLTVKTNNSNIIRDGIQLDYIEYGEFTNVSIENFFEKGLFGCFWESNFQNIIFRSCGAGIEEINGAPNSGVLDFDSHTNLDNRDACNNTNFSKLTFSSCFGTHIRCEAFANTNVNINIFGLYDETYNADGGRVDNLPIYYFKGVKNFNVVGGFLTVNPTNVDRNAYAVRIAKDDRNSAISFTNFEFLQNHSSNNYKQNEKRRLRSFLFLEKKQEIILSNVIINDASGSVGKGQVNRYLIDGEAGSAVFMTNVTFYLKKGYWDINNIINPTISKIGNVTIKYYNDNGPTGEIERVLYQSGKVLSSK